MQRHNFDRVRKMTWPEVVAVSRNISSVDDLRSILDQVGLGFALDRKAAAALCVVFVSRNGIVHGAEDADVDVRALYESIEALIRRMLSRDDEALIRMDLAKAAASAALPDGQ